MKESRRRVGKRGLPDEGTGSQAGEQRARSCEAGASEGSNEGRRGWWLLACSAGACRAQG